MSVSITGQSEEELFEKIDGAIEVFNKNEGVGKGIKVSKTQSDGWLIIKWRQVTWTENNINYLIEIYPNLISIKKQVAGIYMQRPGTTMIIRDIN